MDTILQKLEQEDVRLFNIFHEQEITDFDTFMELDNNNYTRLQLTTKMVKTIQRIRRQCSDDLIVEERLENEPMSEDDNITDNINTPPQNSYRSISLDKVIYLIYGN
ncbi:uncharacterized protein LOC129719190 [Wyeomyia smithii]|uniref:uncharacterized protein LOC129719190 n=1 Tax=Wyeomyia smithii TaxID=174621 RepID=UPI002467C1D2|nr:uncharacterized protein LOC129719190 [Wyeomyia smithii]